MKLSLDAFSSSVLTQEEMNPIIGGTQVAPGTSSCGSNSTNSTGADQDTKSGDSDGD